MTKKFRAFQSYPQYFSIIILVFSLQLSLVNLSPPSIYGHSSYFRSYSNCFYSNVCNGCPSTYTVQTSLMNQNIIKCGLALGQFTKPVSQQFGFGANVTYGSATTDTFSITLSTLHSYTFTIRLFLIVIMDQGTTPMVDMDLHYMNGSNPISAVSLPQQTYTYDIFVINQTIFPNTMNLQVFSFFSCFIAVMQASEFGTRTQMTDVSSVIKNLNVISTRVKISAYMALPQANVVTMIYSPMNIANNILDGNTFSAFLVVWTLTPSIITNSMNYPSWGPNFDLKCFIGNYHNEYSYGTGLNHVLGFNPYTNYFRYDSTGSQLTNFAFFCFGYGLQCGQAFNFKDVYNNQCYTSAGCPVTPYGSNIAELLCPKCFYENCLQCQPLNRSICISCDNTTHRQLISNNCTCMPGYHDNFNISIAICLINCSYYMEGCDSYSCTSQTNCTACQTSQLYYLGLNSTTNQSKCILCNQTINNCSNCGSSTVCTKCQKGTYLSVTNICLDCSTGPVLYCFDCQNLGGTMFCNVCLDGYSSIGSGGLICDCNFTYYLKNCSSCSDPKICTGCPPLYGTTKGGNFIDCMLCSDMIPNCSNCTDYTTCTLCKPSFYFYYNSTSNQTQCQICSIVIQHCILCNNYTSCQLCAPYFGTTSIHLCEACNTTISNCFTCLDSSICTFCEVGYYLLNNSCLVCTAITSNCSECNLVSLVPVCTKCDNGYYLNSQTCILCSSAMGNCLKCQNSTYCDICAAPFIFDTNHSCFNCSVGIYVTGTCTNVSGCANSRLTNGVAFCLSCDISLGFQFDPTHKTCICQSGFIMKNSACHQVCGDSIVNTMQCDDGNLINGDGCSQFCIIQSGYTCTITSNGESDCVLHQDFSITLNYIQRVMGENAALLSFTITPASTKLQFVDWKSVVTFNLTNAVGISYDYSNGQLLVKIDYNSSINNQNISMNVNFDPNSIISKSSSLNFKMIGINGPLVYENNLSDYKNLSILSFVIIGLALLQFLISTYFHKMIGLQTLQCIQTIYFIRMIITDSYGSSSIYGLNGLNYSNGFSYNSGNTNDLSAIPSYFAKLGLSLQFLGNVNIMLIPIFIAGTIYLIYKVRMLYNKSKFVQTSQKQYKGQYIILKRTSDWFYDHYVFVFSILLMFTVSFCTIQSILSQSSSIQTLSTSMSFFSSMVILIFIILIICLSVIEGINKFFNRGTSNKKQNEKNIDYDQNQIFSFSELYISAYLIYYFLLILIITSTISSFQYVKESSFVLTMIYAIFICIWRPYVYRIHNFGIILNQFTVVFFIFTIVISSNLNISQSGYSLLQYLTVCLLIIVNLIAYLRIFIQWKTQKEETQYKNKRVSKIKDQDYYKNKQDALLNNRFVYHSKDNIFTIKKQLVIDVNTQTKNKFLNNLEYEQTKNSYLKNQKYDQDEKQEQKYQQVNNQYLSLDKIKERLRKQHKESILQQEDLE